MHDKIIIKGLRQNNLKNISLSIPKNKIVVFTGVSGSGKSSIVFDTIAAESSRQMNDTYPAFVRSRLPKYAKPNVDSIEFLSPSVIIDQTPLGSTARSTVGTSSEIYSGLRLLFSRIGEPYAGPASFFSFNDPSGMCQECGGLGMVTDIDMDRIIDYSKSLNEGALTDSTLRVGSWYWRLYANSGLFDLDKPLKDYSECELRMLLYGEGLPDEKAASTKDASNMNPSTKAASTKAASNKYKKIEGIYNLYKKRYLTRDVSNISMKKGEQLITQKLCPSCQGRRLNRIALACWINGYSIADMSDMQLTELREVLLKIDKPEVKNLVDTIVNSLTRMIDIGLGYLNLSRPTQTLSGGEAQRVKLVRYLGSSLSDMLYIFDEPSTGMHPRDVYRMNNLLVQLRDRGNTVLVVEHDEDVISIADEVIDVGPYAGSQGGQIVFQGTYDELLDADTLTAKAMTSRATIPDETPLVHNDTLPIRDADFVLKETLPIRDAWLHNLKGVNVDVPLNCICAVTGVAGSGKSSLMQVFTELYKDSVVKIDQKPITANNRSTPASYLGFMDEIRKEFAAANNVPEGMFSFNSLGACPHCKGKGVIVTELAFMDPIVTTCEECDGARFSKEALSYTYRGKNILEVLSMTAADAEGFFDNNNKKIIKKIKAMNEVGLSYLTLGQPMSTLSGGERQRIKLATSLGKKGSIYLLDEPTTGLHPSDISKLMELFRRLVKKGNSVIVIEHNTEVMKLADYIIDIGPDGGIAGGELVFAGTPQEMLAADTITAGCLRIANEGRSASPSELAEMMKIPALRMAGEESKHDNLEYDNNDEEDDAMGYKLNPIGRVESDCGEFRVVLDRKYKEALKGLEGFSHIQVVWWFDGCDNEQSRSVAKLRKPYANGPDEIGTFATRSPQRPNPVAISTCEVIKVDTERAIIELCYIDAITGTPVLDIKPYTPSADRVEEPKVPGWCAHWPKSYESSGDFNWEEEFNF